MTTWSRENGDQGGIEWEAELATLLRRSRRALTAIGIAQTAVFVAVAWLGWEFRHAVGEGGERPSMSELVVSTAYTSFVGSILYFSRKTYVYLVTDKIHHAISERGIPSPPTRSSVERARAVAVGYYLYLTIRPLAGLVVGPVLLMGVLGGVLVVGNVQGQGSAEDLLSRTGLFLLHIFAFISGYTSSDIFDYFSEVGRRMSRRIDLP